ncbi:hypothetical protein ACLB2K_053931 [Fragaria x ananassa]
MDSSLSSIPTSGVFKSLSDSPPTHCSLNIESFSLLSEFLDGNSSDPEDAYESEEFKAGGYKWKLVIYPRGNKKKKVEDHISVYLQIAGANSLEMGWEVYVDFRLFLLDQNKNIYMVFEDAFTRRNCIHGAKLDVGFDKLVPLDEFHDASHGYLVDDKCVFGAEVFVCKEKRRGMGECISRVKSPKTYKHIWKLRNFSSLTDPYYTSEPFTVEDQKWIIQLYPKGVDQQNRHIGIYLQLVDRKATPPATKVFAELSIRIVHPLCSDLCWSRTDPAKLDVGFDKLVPQDEFHDASHEYLVGFGNDGDGDGGWECSELGNLQQALCLHAHAIQTGFMNNIFVGASLIESYSKCGRIENAVRLFEGMMYKDVVIWSAMIADYGIHGQGREALKVCDDMVKHTAVTPNDVTFTSVLSACSHSGLVVDLGIFSMMLHQYQLKPRPEHYGILVDLLGRTGELDKSMEIVERMPNPAEPHVWGALLGACRIHNNVKLGEVVAKRLLELEPDDAGYYVLLSNIYAMDDKWENVSNLRTSIREKGLKRIFGQSVVEAGSEIHSFAAGDIFHPEFG